MRVALVIFSPNFFGGGNKFVSQLISCLVENGIDVAVCSMDLPIKDRSYNEFFNIKNWFVPKVKWNVGKLYKIMINQKIALKKLVKKFKPNIIIGADTEPSILTGIKIKKILYVHFPTELKAYAHSLFHEIYRSIYWWQHYKAIKELDAIVCNSEYTKNITYLLWSSIQPDKNKYLVIHPCVDIDKFMKKVERDHNRICYVGRLDKNKGIDFVLEAFKNIKYEIPHVKLSIVGGVKGSVYAEKYYPELLSKVKNMNDIEIKIDVPDEIIVNILLKSRCMLSYNPEEHFGIVPIEAMAAGCPPIVADGGGQRETVIHNETGFLAKTPEDLIIYAKKLLMDEELFKNMSEKARMHARKFDKKEFCNKWLQLIQNIAEK